MRISLVALLAFLGCLSVSTGSAMAEYGVQKLTLDSFRQSEPEPEAESEEAEGESCTACYPPPG
jgi:peptide subunit release factor RF-3